MNLDVFLDDKKQSKLKMIGVLKFCDIFTFVLSFENLVWNQLKCEVCFQSSIKHCW